MGPALSETHIPSDVDPLAAFPNTTATPEMLARTDSLAKRSLESLGMDRMGLNPQARDGACYVPNCASIVLSHRTPAALRRSTEETRVCNRAFWKWSVSNKGRKTDQIRVHYVCTCMHAHM